MGATVLMHLQKKYLRYWRNRTGAGAWVDNADIESHAAARRRARKGDPEGLSCAYYKGTTVTTRIHWTQNRRGRVELSVRG